MTQRTLKLNKINGALSNASATPIVVDIPQGTYNVVRLRAICGGTMTVAKVFTHEIKVDDKVAVPEISGARTQIINRFNEKDDYSATVLEWHFGQELADTLFEKRAGELSLFPVNGAPRYDKGVQWIITPDGTQDGTGTIEFEMVIDDDSKPDFGGSDVDGDLMFRALRKANALTASAAGDVGLNVDFGEVRASQNNFCRQVHIMHANATHLEIMRDSAPVIRKSTVAQIQRAQTKRNRTVQAGHLAYDFTRGGREFDSLPPKNSSGNVANLALTLTLSAADTVTVYTDLYARIDRI